MHPIRDDEEDILSRLESKLEYVSAVIQRLKERNAELQEQLRAALSERDDAAASRDKALAEAEEAARAKAEALALIEQLKAAAAAEAEEIRGQAARLAEEADSLRNRQKQAATRIKNLLAQMEQMDLLAEN
jgi:FtsZ-binding cell division protein ZapB